MKMHNERTRSWPRFYSKRICCLNSDILCMFLLFYLFNYYTTTLLALEILPYIPTCSNANINFLCIRMTKCFLVFRFITYCKSVLKMLIARIIEWYFSSHQMMQIIVRVYIKIRCVRIKKSSFIYLHFFWDYHYYEKMDEIIYFVIR